MRFTIMLAVLAISAAAHADPLTVGDVIGINSALSQMNCAPRVIKDGSKETQICDPFDWHRIYGDKDPRAVSIPWQIATELRATMPIVQQYQQEKSAAVRDLPRKPDGNPTDAAAAQFLLDDKVRVAQSAHIDMTHFKKSDLLPLNLQPGLIEGLMPIIDIDDADNK